MSFVKALSCDSCRKIYSITEVGFPEDLYDQILFYKIQQLLWICSSCKTIKDRTAASRDFDVVSLQSEIFSLKSTFDGICEKILPVNEDSKKEEIKDLPEISQTLPKINQCVDVADYAVSSASSPSTTVDITTSLSRLKISAENRDSLVNGNSLLPSSPRVNLAPKRNKAALELMHSILKEEIKIDSTEQATSKAIVNKFIETLLPALKQEEVFCCIFDKLYYTGSSYSDLRISDATEYDIDICLKLPPQFLLTVEFFPETMAYAKIKWEVKEDIPEIQGILKVLRKRSENGYIDPAKISAWFQSLFVKQNVEKLEIDGIKKIKIHENGPARTVKLEIDSDFSIDLDLVPVFVFNYSVFHDTPVMNTLKKYPFENPNEMAIFVPKLWNRQHFPGCHLGWRIVFPEVEKHIMHDKSCAKPIIKLLKLLRDKQNWKLIASYHLNHVVLWELSKNMDKNFWNGATLFERFLEVLKQSCAYLQQGKLPYFFYQEYNLFHHKHSVAFMNFSKRLSIIICSIESDHTNMKEFFLSSP